VTTGESKYPECDKIVAVHGQSQKLGEFLDWLEGKGIHLGRWAPTPAELVMNRMTGKRIPIHDEETFVELFISREKLLAEFFGIDLNKVEAERQALLEAIREKQKNKE
jgi:hypothetical protein